MRESPTAKGDNIQNRKETSPSSLLEAGRRRPNGREGNVGTSTSLIEYTSVKKCEEERRQVRKHSSAGGVTSSFAVPLSELALENEYCPMPGRRVFAREGAGLHRSLFDSANATTAEKRSDDDSFWDKNAAAIHRTRSLNTDAIGREFDELLNEYNNPSTTTSQNNDATFLQRASFDDSANSQQRQLRKYSSTSEKLVEDFVDKSRSESHDPTRQTRVVEERTSHSRVEQERMSRSGDGNDDLLAQRRASGDECLRSAESRANSSWLRQQQRQSLNGKSGGAATTTKPSILEAAVKRATSSSSGRGGEASQTSSQQQRQSLRQLPLSRQSQSARTILPPPTHQQREDSSGLRQHYESLKSTKSMEEQQIHHQRARRRDVDAQLSELSTSFTLLQRPTPPPPTATKPMRNVRERPIKIERMGNTTGMRGGGHNEKERGSLDDAKPQNCGVSSMKSCQKGEQPNAIAQLTEMFAEELSQSINTTDSSPKEAGEKGWGEQVQQQQQFQHHAPFPSGAAAQANDKHCPFANTLSEIAEEERHVTHSTRRQQQTTTSTTVMNDNFRRFDPTPAPCTKQNPQKDERMPPTTNPSTVRPKHVGCSSVAADADDDPLPQQQAYLVESTSFYHLARVISIAQHWLLARRPAHARCARCVSVPVWWRNNDNRIIRSEERRFGKRLTTPSDFDCLLDLVKSSRESASKKLHQHRNNKPDDPLSLRRQQNIVDEGCTNENRRHNAFGQPKANGIHRTVTLPVETQRRERVGENVDGSERRGEEHGVEGASYGGLRERFMTTLPRFLRKTRSEFAGGTSSSTSNNNNFGVGGGGEDELMRATMGEVEQSFDDARRARSRWRSADVRKIEDAIYGIARRLRRREPVSKAQAMANEELMRTRLAGILLDFNDADDTEGFSYGDILREPLGILLQKMNNLEEGYCTESNQINKDLSELHSKNPSRWSDSMHRRKRSLTSRGEELARLTPLIGEVQQKLNNLDDACCRGQQKGKLKKEVAAKEVAAEETGQMFANRSACSTPYEERKYVHDLLTSINNEINLIHGLYEQQQRAQRKQQQKARKQPQKPLSAAAAAAESSSVVGVLAKVSGQLDEILDAIVIAPPRGMESTESLATTTVPSRIMDGSSEEQRSSSLNNEPEEEEDVWPAKKGLAIPRTGRGLRSLQRRMLAAETLPNEGQQATTTKTKETKVQRNEAAMFDPGCFDVLAEIVNSGKHSKTKTPSKVMPKKQQIENAAKAPDSTKLQVEQNRKQAKSTKEALAADEEAVETFPRFRRQDLNYRYSTTLPMNRLRLKMPEVRLKAPPPAPPPKQQQKTTHLVEIERLLLFDENDDKTRKGTKTAAPAPNEQQQKQRRRDDPYIFLQHDDDEEDEDAMLDDEEGEAESSCSIMTLTTESVPVLKLRRGSSTTTQSRLEQQLGKGELEQQRQRGLLLPEARCDESFRLNKRRRQTAVLNSVIRPELWARVRATFDGNSFQVDVDQISQCGRDSVILVSEEFYERRESLKIGRELDSISEEETQDEVDDENEAKKRAGHGGSSNDEDAIANAHAKLAVSINARSDKGSVYVQLEELPWGEVGLEVQSIGDNASANDDELLALSTMSATMFRSVKVAENEAELSRSMSRRSSQKSLLETSCRSAGGGLTTTTGAVGGRQSLAGAAPAPIADDQHTFVSTEDEIPGYVIRLGSTASITCELNPSVLPANNIEWFRGRDEHVCPKKGKFDRFKEPLLEMLVISNVQPQDGQLYSIQVDGKRYPVAYLMVEEGGLMDESVVVTTAAADGRGTTNDDDAVLGIGEHPSSKGTGGRKGGRTAADSKAYAYFVSPPQTQFVMEGETATISCQMSQPMLDICWYKGGEFLKPDPADQSSSRAAHGATVRRQMPRIQFECDKEGWYRVIMREVCLADQGVYHACYQGRSTSITLVVEEHIEEREVQVSGADTDDEELNDYQVPCGSTATIACELETGCAHLPLHWQRNHRDLDDKIGAIAADGKNRLEHIISGTKHYLIIHSAQPKDSGVYSVRIANNMFKVAQLTITDEDGRNLMSSSKVKRISSSSLNRC